MKQLNLSRTIGIPGFGRFSCLRFSVNSSNTISRRLVAEAALKEMNLNMADACFVRAKDYANVQFVKKLRSVNNEAIREARVATYFRNFDQAEKIFIEADRRYIRIHLYNLCACFVSNF